jgi:8-oxo-dGTP pyrophosphatase MutT (NUDIX family)
VAGKTIKNKTFGEKCEDGTKLFKQYAALPCTRRDGELMVMLVTSRETHRWIIPKGWPEKDLKGYQVAEREAFEEAGLIGEIGKKPMATFHYLKRITETKRKRCGVDVFLLSVRQELEEWPEKAQRQRKWMTPGEAATRVAEVELIDLFLKLAGSTSGVLSDA